MLYITQFLPLTKTKNAKNRRKLEQFRRMKEPALCINFLKMPKIAQVVRVDLNHLNSNYNPTIRKWFDHLQTLFFYSKKSTYSKTTTESFQEKLNEHDIHSFDKNILSFSSTTITLNCNNPQWNQVFSILCNPGETIVVKHLVTMKT